MNIATFQEQYSSSSAGTAGTPSSFNTRALNTVITNTITGCSLNTSTGAVTLATGNYLLRGSAVSNMYDKGKLGISDGTNIVGSGLSVQTQDGTAFTQTNLVASFELPLTVPSSGGNYTLQHYVGSGLPLANPSGNLGAPVSSGQPEVYAQLTIEAL